MPVDIGWEFPQDSQVIQLNHAGIGPWPRRTRDAVIRFAEEYVSIGAHHYAQWELKEKQLKSQLQQLINAPSTDDIALLKNTSEALSTVAYGLPWQSGDNVVISNVEFPSNRIVWESLAKFGVEVKVAILDDKLAPETAIEQQIDSNTRLVSVSSIQYSNGLSVNLQTLGSMCKQRQVLLCIDAIQSIGAVEFDLEKIQADFVVADGHKWMLGPEGIALFYCRQEVRESLHLNQYGWHMVRHIGDYERQEWQADSSARRFECGSPNMLGIHALSASLSLLLEVGMASIASQIKDNIEYLTRRLNEIENIEMLSPPYRLKPRGGILVFKHKQQATHLLYKTLRQKGVVCAKRHGGIRFSPHFYHNSEELDQVIEFIRQV